jgi:hypothetical protein
VAQRDLTPPSSGQTTAGGLVPLRQQCVRRCMPLMSNVRPQGTRMCSTHRLANSAARARSALAAALRVLRSAEDSAVLARKANGSFSQRCRLRAPAVANVGQFVGAAEAAALRASSPTRIAAVFGAVLVRRANGRVRSALVAASRGLRSAQEGAVFTRRAAKAVRLLAWSPVRVASLGAMRSVAGSVVRQRAAVVQLLRPNPSIERTNNGGRGCAASAALRAPLFAAHVER